MMEPPLIVLSSSSKNDLHGAVGVAVVVSIMPLASRCSFLRSRNRSRADFPSFSFSSDLTALLLLMMPPDKEEEATIVVDSLSSKERSGAVEMYRFVTGEADRLAGEGSAEAEAARFLRHSSNNAFRSFFTAPSSSFGLSPPKLVRRLDLLLVLEEGVVESDKAEGIMGVLGPRERRALRDIF